MAGTCQETKKNMHKRAIMQEFSFCSVPMNHVLLIEYLFDFEFDLDVTYSLSYF